MTTTENSDSGTATSAGTDNPWLDLVTLPMGHAIEGRRTPNDIVQLRFTRDYTRVVEQTYQRSVGGEWRLENAVGDHVTNPDLVRQLRILEVFLSLRVSSDGRVSDLRTRMGQLRTQLSEVQQDKADQAVAFEAFKRHATETLHEEANRRNFCTDFDDVMEAIGLPRRNNTYLVEVAVNGTVTVEVEGIDADAAMQAVDESHIVDAVQTLSSDRTRLRNGIEWTVNEANLRD